jgi:ammonium transporter, Amt family
MKETGRRVFARRGPLLALLAFLATTVAATVAAAAETAPRIDTGDTAWVLTASAMVLLMTPGLAFFYGGLVRRKNILSVLMQCFVIICIVSIQWVYFGYSLSFGPDHGGLIGDLSWFGLKGVGAEPSAAYAATIPHLVFMVFQMMFAVITPALVIGAFAERMKFSTLCVFSLLWATLVYAPVTHWVWGDGGFLRAGGTLDFAGGIVVHINAGIAALVAALMLGRRLGYPSNVAPPHNLPFAVLGAGLLWFGWFGFNAGSALGAGAVAGGAFVATHLAGSAAGLAWSLIEWMHNGRPTVLGIITGSVAGLAAVTPASGFVKPTGAVWIGIGAAALCYYTAVILKAKFGYDDTLDAFGVHGVGGIWGVLATGLFASKAVNPAGADGLFYGGTALLWAQVKGTLVTTAWSLAGTFVILKALDLVMGLRVSEHEERVGLDLTGHRESAYTLLD